MRRVGSQEFVKHSAGVETSIMEDNTTWARERFDRFWTLEFVTDLKFNYELGNHLGFCSCSTIFSLLWPKIRPYLQELAAPVILAICGPNFSYLLTSDTWFLRPATLPRFMGRTLRIKFLEAEIARLSKLRAESGELPLGDP